MAKGRNEESAGSGRSGRARWFVVAVAFSLVAWQLPAFAEDANAGGQAPTQAAGADSAGTCGARAPSDPAPWEATLPTADVSSDLSAADPGCVREVGRTANGVVWANPDGTVTARQYPSDVNYQATDGSWQAIDTRLVSDGQGGTTNKAGPFGVHFAGTADGAQLVSLDTGGASLSFGFAGATRTDSGQLARPAAVPSVVSGGADADTLTYAGAMAGVDLQYQLLPDTLKEALVLDRPLPAGVAPEFTFSVQLNGLRAQTAEDGTVQFVNAATGAVAFWIPAGLALDGSGNPDQGVEPATTPVSTRLVASDNPAVAELVVSIDSQWLTDPARVFPVTIDPSFASKTNADAYVSDAAVNTTYNGSAQYNSGAGQYWDRVGTASGTEYRSFLQYPSVSWLANYVISSASWSGYAYSIGGGSSVNVNLKPANASWVSGYITWNNQPAVRSSIATVAYTAGSQWKTIDVSSWVYNWAQSVWGSYGIRLHGPATKYANIAAQEAPASVQSYLTITYDAPPTVSRPLTGGHYVDSTVNTHTPTLSVQVDDSDSPSSAGYFEIWNSSHTVQLQSGSGSTVKAGERSTKTISTLADGTYSWRAHAYLGYTVGVSTPWQTLTIDTSTPAAPTVSGLPTINTWSAGTSVTPTFNQSPSEAFEFLWGVDVGSNPTTEQLATSGSSGSPGGVPLTSGWHDLAVRTVDAAGNLSSVTHHTFGLNDGGFTTPEPDFTTQSAVTAQVVSKTAYDGIALQWRRSESDTWQTIPAGDVTYQSSGTGISSWPVTTTPGTYSSSFPALVWDAGSTTAGVDGSLQTRVAFYTSGVFQTNLDDPSIRTGALNSLAFGGGYASAPAGPGSVNPLTGNLSLAATDVSSPAGEVTRTFQSLDQNASGSVFGPGWTSNLLVGSSQYRSLSDNGDTVLVTGADGSELAFRLQSGGGYASPDGVTDLTLTKISSTRFELVQLNSQTFGFTNYDTGASTTFLPSDVTGPTGKTDTMTWALDTGTGLTRPTMMQAAAPAGVSCSSSPLTTRGCRTLTFDYATSTTATGTSPSDWGDYDGQLTTVHYTAWDPDLTTPAMRTVDLNSYLYDDAGHLRASWDPRISPALKTIYSYDSDGHVATITPPGEDAWTFAYAPLSGEPASTGRLDTVSRPTLPSGTATSTYRYQIPLTTGGGGPYDLDSSTVASWAQHDVPTNATAVYPPDQTPSGTPPSSYTRARVYYVNVQGQLVNTAAPGGYITTSEHDEFGNVTRTLTAGNRQRALASSGSSSAQAATAELLDSQTVYDDQGINVIDTYGPAHVVDLPDGTHRSARAHVHNTYDQGAPGGATYNLVTTTAESAAPTDGTSEQDTRTTTNAYDLSGDTTGWTLGTPLRTTTDPGTGTHLNLATTTLYDASTGNMTARRLPASPSGGDAHETLFIAYTAGTNPTDSACSNRPEWAELPCKQTPAAQPGTSGLPDLPTTQVTKYDIYQQPEETVDTNGSDTRTTTITYDAGGRQSTKSVTSTVGTSLPTITSTYDTSTGLPYTTSDGTRTVSRAYDTLGRLTDYYDADSNHAQYTYDTLDRVSTANDGKATTTYTYDDVGSEHRGLPTTISDATAGTFTATYDADGKLATQTYPGSLTATHSYDEAGEPTNLVYSKATGTWPASPATYNIHGERTTASNTLEQFTHNYDATGRLTNTTDTQADTCIKRSYTFDADTNRTQLSATTTGGAGNTNPCLNTTGTTTTTSYSYDGADRITGTGYTYDAFGRTTGVPASNSPSGSATTLGYYTNDLVNTTAVGGTTVTYNLDPKLRDRTWVSSADTQTHTNHFTGDVDTAVWTSENTAGTSWNRNIIGFGGLAATINNAGTVTIDIANIHDDIFSTVASSTTDWLSSSTSTATDEYGNPTAGSPSTGTRYDYLGTDQRFRDAATGLQLMGARAYNSLTGRFLQVDAVEGGSCNAYDYTCGDGVNSRDLDGLATQDVVATFVGVRGLPGGFHEIPLRQGNKRFGLYHIELGGSHRIPATHPYDAFAFQRTQFLLSGGTPKCVGNDTWAYQAKFWEPDYESGGGRWRLWRVLVNIRTGRSGYQGFRGIQGIVTWWWVT